MKENSREENIKILEEHAQFYLNDEDRQSLQNLIEAYKELEEENKTLNERNQYLVKYRAKLEKELYESNENYIPISLVEEKIEELIKEGRHYNANKIEVLQELLEKR